MLENVGLHGFSTTISTQNLLKHVANINLNHLSLMMKSSLFFRTYRTHSLPTIWTLPSYHSNPFDWNSFILFWTSLTTQTLTLLSTCKKVPHQEPSPPYNQLDSGDPITHQMLINPTYKSAKTTGKVPTKTHPLHDHSFSIEAGFIEEIPSIREAERRWPTGIALGKLGVVCADNRDPRLVLDSTICGMNGRCHLPEKQRLPNLRHVSFFLSTCPPLQDEWQGASIDIKAAHKRMLIREEERGALLFQFENKTYAYRTAHFGAKTSAWHWGRVSGALLRLLHKLLLFRHAAWVYVDDFLFLFPNSTAHIQFTLAVIFLRVLGAPLSWKKLEFDSTIEWNGWSIQPTLMTAQLPKFKFHKITTLIYTLLEHPWRKNLEKIIGIILWATSMVHHTRFLLTSFIVQGPLCNPSHKLWLQPTQWEYFLTTLNDDAAISVQNTLHLPIGACCRVQTL